MSPTRVYLDHNATTPLARAKLVVRRFSTACSTGSTPPHPEQRVDKITHISTNQQRLMHRLGRVPPAEAEAHYYSEHVTDHPPDG